MKSNFPLFFPSYGSFFWYYTQDLSPTPGEGHFLCSFSGCFHFLNLHVDLWTVWVNCLSALKFFLLCMNVIFSPAQFVTKTVFSPHHNLYHYNRSIVLGYGYSSMVESLPQTPNSIIHTEEKVGHISGYISGLPFLPVDLCATFAWTAHPPLPVFYLVLFFFLYKLWDLIVYIQEKHPFGILIRFTLNS